MYAQKAHNEAVLATLEPGTPVNLWVDDRVQAPSGALWAETVAEAVSFLQEHAVEDMSLDYCLKGAETGDEVLYWLRDNLGFWPTGEVVAHSSSASCCALINTVVSDIIAHLNTLDESEVEL